LRQNRSIPAAAVFPVLVVEDVAAHAEWLVSVLGFRERLHIPPNHRIQLTYGESALVVAERGAGGPQNVVLRVDDVDDVYTRAIAAGAASVTAPTDYPYGERQAAFDDPAGHRWTISQTMFDSDPASWGGILSE
jgi:uncharacterized glyoxalase superfamily protein PhnB